MRKSTTIPEVVRMAEALLDRGIVQAGDETGPATVRAIEAVLTEIERHAGPGHDIARMVNRVRGALHDPPGKPDR